MIDPFHAFDAFDTLPDFWVAKLAPVVLMPQLVRITVSDRCHDQRTNQVSRVDKQHLSIQVTSVNVRASQTKRP